ncbi:S41 family peptidase [Myxococcus landrumensis]|uniref:Peptidase S41 n=1 Tax=Myxococcus landrumensis TaxID=2813577 RepID=A0ABX7MXB9_9BACT|nr:S41 family peptidase [Myxococcus landrumus]QSQ11075.1 peptidase S41 [Myxococcus landrumus]
MRRVHLPWVAVLLLALTSLPSHVLAQQAPEARAVERRIQLVKLWGTVRFRHPQALAKPAEWDAAFLAALPKVEAARDAQSYAAAVQGMLAALGDPATLVEPETPPTVSIPPPTLRALKSWEKDVLVLDLRNLLGPEAQSAWTEMEQALDADAAKARAVVLDLRMRGLTRYGLPWVLPALLPHFIEGELTVPGTREVAHMGLKPQDGEQSVHETHFIVSASTLVAGTPGKKPALLVFLVDSGTALDLSVLALQAQGKALLVAEGPLDDSSINFQIPLPLGEGYRAMMSINEPVLPLSADLARPVRARMDGPDEGMRQALSLATRPPKRGSLAARPLRPLAPWRPEPAYADALYPSRELRILAGAKLWTAVDSFFAYPDLMDQPWETRLPAILEKMEKAQNATEYVLALAEVGTWLRDGHVHVRGHPELQRFFGVNAPLWVTDIDGKAVVLDVFVPESVPGLAVGDIIEKVNGEPIDERARKFAPYTSGSTPDFHRHVTLRRALAGPDGSEARLTVRDAKGIKEVKLTYKQGQGFPPSSRKEPFQVLEGNIGLVDLALLEAWQVPALFEKLKDTRGIVFDLRNYPRGSLWALAPYLDVKGSRPFALGEAPFVGGLHSGWLKNTSHASTSAPFKYQGRTVTLIDTRTMSQAEHTGLMLEGTADTVFVGSPTAGANGDITHAVLPGGVRFTFTGANIRHGDGRQLQRKGLEPHVKLRPTLAGLRAGRDELLERAIQILKEKPAQPTATRRE